MEITWYGHSCFRMMERGVASIVTDPYADSFGLGELRLKADIVTISHDTPGHAAYDNVKGAAHILSRPGEYEIGGVFMTGVSTYDHQKPVEEIRRNIVFVYNFGSLTICHLGDLDHVPEQSEIESLGEINVLLVPVGGGGGLTSGQAAEVINLIEPGIVVPMHYALPGSSLGLDPLDKFLKEMGVAGTVETRSSLKVTSGSLDEETQVVVLEISQ